MEKDEKDRICQRALKFLGFQISVSEFQISDELCVVLRSSNNEQVYGIDENNCYLMNSLNGFPLKDGIEQMFFDYIWKSKYFIVLSKSNIYPIDPPIDPIENIVENPFWRCGNAEEMAIKLDLLSGEDGK